MHLQPRQVTMLTHNFGLVHFNTLNDCLGSEMKLLLRSWHILIFCCGFLLVFLHVLYVSLALVAAAREIGLEVSADKTKYMVMSRDHNAGRIHSVRMDKSTFERVEEFKYLGTTLTNQNAIQEEIMSRLRSGNACYHSVQNFCLPGCYPKI